nr:MAG TPA: hypothetical protein [Caudoviricetes sp.]
MIPFNFNWDSNLFLFIKSPPSVLKDTFILQNIFLIVKYKSILKG